MASCALLAGLKPYEFGSKFASHSGSKANFANVCLALSLITGIPRGRFSTLPGYGIQTLFIV